MFTVAYAHGASLLIHDKSTVKQLNKCPRQRYVTSQSAILSLVLVFIKPASVPKRRKRTKEEERYDSASHEQMRTVNCTHIWHRLMQAKVA